MPFLPVAAREVREASRQPRTYRWRWVTAAAALALLVFVHRVSRYSPSQGRELFIAISTAAFIYCLLAGAVRTADTISEEKRDNTLGLLFLTDLKGWDIIFGKLLSSSVNCFFGLLAMMPMLAIPLLMGGVQWNEFLKVILNLVNTLFFSISWGFLISALFRQSAITISTALVTMIFFGGVLPLMSVFTGEELKVWELAEILFTFSPLQTHINSLTNPGRHFNHYWTPLLVCHVVTWINLRLSVFLLPRLWQEVPKNKKTERWRERFRAWRFGKGITKANFRTRLLDQNPLFWLSNRERVSSFWLMLLCAVSLTGATIFGAAVSRNRVRNDEFLAFWCVSLVLIHLTIAFRIAMAASSRLAEDRRSGALELLLGTELSIREIMRGHWLALRRQFFGPGLIVTLAAVFGLAQLLLLMSFDVNVGKIWDTLVEIVRRMFRPGASSEMGWVFLILISVQLLLMLNWIALAWVGMWFGLREKRSGFSTWNTLALVILPPWIVLISAVAFLEETRMLRYVTDEQMFKALFFSGWTLGLSYMLFVTTWARRSLLTRFREVASERYAGPRRFPWAPIRRFAFRFVTATGVVIILLLGARFWIDHSGQRAWNSALAAHPQFAARLAKPREEAAIVSEAQNFARSPIFVAMSAPGKNRKQINWNFSQVSPGQSENVHWGWTMRQRRNLAGIRQGYLEGKILKTTNFVSDAAAVLAGLSAYDKDLATLKADAAVRPRTQFQVSNNPPPNPNFGFQRFFYRDLRDGLRPLVGTLALRASARVALGEAESAFDDILLAVRIIEGIAHDPQSLVPYHEMLLDLVQPIYDGLAVHGWNDSQLQYFQTLLNQDFWTRYQLFCDDSVLRLIQEGDQIIRARDGDGRRRESWLGRQFPIGSIRKVQAGTLNWSAVHLPKAVDLKARRINMKAAHDARDKRMEVSSRDWRHPDQFIVAARSLGFMQTTADEIILACAIERFRNDHKKLPDALDQLVPKYIAAVPNDVFTGKPLRYKIKSDSHYILYSIGEDGVDDGGSAAMIFGSWVIWQSETKGDWVWNSEAVDPPTPKKRRK